ncbi:MAG: hypothetical protein AAFX99_15705, partial [Myxococcota bacterium]
PAGEDVIGPFLENRKGFVKEVVRPLQQKEETIYVVPGRTDRQAIGRLVVGTKGEALPHRHGLRIRHPTTVVARGAAVGHLFDPVGETAHELAVVVGVAG